jgi:predicted ATP-dependent protease
VNEKIEGFFDVCRARGLTGEQGVVIPRANVKHLMLREDVVEAARGGLFHVYAVGDADEAISLLTGLVAGERDSRGRVPEGTVNHLVAAKLAQMSLDRQAYGTGQPQRGVKRWRKPTRTQRGDRGDRGGA